MLAHSKKYLLALFSLAILLPGPAWSASKSFATPEEAVQALVTALQSSDPSQSLTEIFGAESKDLWVSGDPVEDKEAKRIFLNRATQAKNLVKMDDSHVILAVGADRWPFPIPLVKSASGWSFDTAMGKEELLNRRIGANELTAIATARDFVAAEKDYQAKNRGGDQGYAQKFLSDPGKKDGLYWDSKDPKDASPIAASVIKAQAEGYSATTEKTKGLLYRGYYYRILTKQDKDANGGAVDYLKDGKMTQGFALLAYPAKWNNSGVMSFQVNQDGKIFEKNLGDKTAELAQQMTAYNPDSSWKAVQP